MTAPSKDSGSKSIGSRMSGIADPSATHAIQHGYQHDILTNPDGSQSGRVTLSDGTQREAWEWFREDRLTHQQPTYPTQPIKHPGRNIPINPIYKAQIQAKVQSRPIATGTRMQQAWTPALISPVPLGRQMPMRQSMGFMKPAPQSNAQRRRSMWGFG